MMAASHVAVGVSAWAVAAPFLTGHAADPLGLGLAALASLAPDMDHPQSWFGRRIAPLSHLVSAIFGHRGITHSALAVGMCAWAAGMWGGQMGIWPLVVGYVSHLLADGLTPAGVPLLWPLKTRFALPVARTGGLVEWGIVALVMAGAAWATGWTPLR